MKTVIMNFSEKARDFIKGNENLHFERFSEPLQSGKNYIFAYPLKASFGNSKDGFIVIDVFHVEELSQSGVTHSGPKVPKINEPKKS